MPVRTEYETVTGTDAFYGVYHGQAALPLEPDQLNWLVWEGMEDVVVYSHDSGTEVPLYRDSFGSSVAPLLIDSYAEITLVDIRYMNPGMVGQFVDFAGADILMLYSTLILNSSSALRK